MIVNILCLTDYSSFSSYISLCTSINLPSSLFVGYAAFKPTGSSGREMGDGRKDTAVSTKVVSQKCKSVRDNADWYYG